MRTSSKLLAIAAALAVAASALAPLLMAAPSSDGATAAGVENGACPEQARVTGGGTTLDVETAI